MSRKGLTHEDYTFRRIKSAILGFVVGDAMGVPAEFMSRDTLKADPVTDMRSGGVHNQIAGTWSDDTSMTLCMMESLTEKGVDYADQMERFTNWLLNAAYTAHDEVFDVGGATKTAIFNYAKHIAPLECGGKSDYSCGNGSLMRILPLALFLYRKYHPYGLDENIANTIHSASMCTHAHRRCQMACGVYSSVVFQAFRGGNMKETIKWGVRSALSYYKEQDEFSEVFGDFQSLETIDKWEEQQIQSSGYVLHTLQAALWCLLTTEGYAECILKAVNLGDDSDTTAAVVGGLAGLWYDENTIPANWIGQLAKAGDIEKRAARFAYACMELK